jgi:anthranilate phosphoribosyltransferase
MRDLAVHPAIPAGKPAVDTVGTGGDGSGSLNISTGTGLLAAAAGARVVKHGNRSVSSKSGSADVLESLGMPVPLDEAASIAALEALNFTFLFAPAFHPAMKAIMPVRGALGVRTVFNILGPLANPAAPPFMLIGAFSRDMAKLMADTLSGMDIERAFVVHGEPGWDEATPAGDFVLFDVTPGAVKASTRTPEDYAMRRCAPAELKGGDAAHNAAELARVMTGEDDGPHRDALVMGASLVLELTGDAADLTEGVKMAADTIDSGRAGRFLDDFRRYFAG